MPPTSDEQIQFMVNIQRLLDEGLFTASYKFALLLALADLSIEHGDDSGAPLELATEAIAETSTKYAPWYIVPADRKWFRNLFVATIIVQALKDLDPKPASLIEETDVETYQKELEAE